MDFRKAIWGEANGISHKGHIVTTFAQLEEVFGEPEYLYDDDRHRLTAEFNIVFADGTVASVHDLNGTTRDPQGGWRYAVAGHTEKAWHHVADALGTLVSIDNTESAVYRHNNSGTVYAYKRIKPSNAAFHLWIRDEGDN